MAVRVPRMPSPSADALSDLESWLGQPLPAAYIEFVRAHDGAEPEENSIVTGENEVAVSRFISVNEAAQLAGQIDSFPRQVIPFAEDNCGNYFYVEPRSGCIRFWDHETDSEGEVVARDVSHFIAKLTQLDTSDVKLSPGQVKRIWVNPSFKPEFRRRPSAHFRVLEPPTLA